MYVPHVRFHMSAVCLIAAVSASAETAPFTITTIFPSATQTSSGLQFPAGLVMDTAGNLYISDWATNQVIRRSASGAVTVVAGTAEGGYSGDGGPATSAKLNRPRGMAIDSAGRLLIADTENYRIRRIDASGVITTVAGNGFWSAAQAPDGAPATEGGIGVDPDGSQIAADSLGNFYYMRLGTVIQVDSNGLVHTVWNAGIGPGLLGARTLGIDNQNNLYVANGNQIYKRTPAGVFTTFFVDTVGGLSVATSISVSPTRGVCYTTYTQVTCVANSGVRTFVAGTTLPGLGGDGGPAASALLKNPDALAFDAAGNILIADGGNGRIRKVDVNSIITTLMKGAPAVPVRYVRYVAADPAGNVYVTDQVASAVWRVAPNGTQSLFAGTGSDGFGGDGGPASDSSVSGPSAITTDANGNVYFTEIGSHTVRKVTNDGVIHTIAGTGKFGFSGDGGSATIASLNTPDGIAVDGSGNVFIADTYNNRVRRITPDGIIATVAGAGPTGFATSPSSGDGGPATAAQLNNPTWIAVGPDGLVYVVDTGRIRAFRVGGNITAVTNGVCSAGVLNGPIASVSFCGPAGLAFSASGDLHVADQGNNRIVRIDSSGIVSTVAGNGVAGNSGDNGPAIWASLNAPAGIALDGSGALYIANTGGTSVRRVSPGVPCGIDLSSAALVLDAGSLSGSFSVTASPNCAFTAATQAPWIHVTGGSTGQSSGTVLYTIDMNAASGARSDAIVVASSGSVAVFNVFQAGAGCQFAFAGSSVSIPFGTQSGSAQVMQTPPNCAAWEVKSDKDWLKIAGNEFSAGSSFVYYTATNNTTTQSRTAVLNIGSSTRTIIQDPSPVFVTTPQPGATLTCTANRFSWTTTGAVQFRYTLSTEPGGADIAAGFTNAGSLVINGIPLNGKPVYFALWLTVSGQYWEPDAVTAIFNTAASADSSACPLAPPPLGFFPTTPCRAADTRLEQGGTGPFGPPSLVPYVARDFPIPSACGLGNHAAAAYSLNFTVVPHRSLDFLSVWQTGQPYPSVSTLNSPDGSILANAAIVPAGSNGAITVVAGQATDVIIDANGYFAPANGQELLFYPVTPCRLADTRPSQGKTGPFGPPALGGYAGRDFKVVGSCGVPASALAFALNVTTVPQSRLDFLTVWPAGRPYPGASTLNSPDGSIIANAAIVPAGTNGSVTVVAGNPTDLIIDVNGYFAPPGSAGGLHFYAITPCRVADTRPLQGKSGVFGFPNLQPYAGRDFPISAAGCQIPASAKAYALNVTAIPQGHLDFVSVWPAGEPYPTVSTLNDPKGMVIANMTIVPAGANGAVTVVAGNATDLVIDVNGYFSP